MKKLIAYLELTLILSLAVTTSYLISNINFTNETGVGESDLIILMREKFVEIFGKNLVSAQAAMNTCLVNQQGTYCQEYPQATCNQQCGSTCLPTSAAQTFECKIGTCIDSNEGTCSPNTPKALCENNGGTWDVKGISEIPQCRAGCCLIGNQAQFVTEQACNALGNRLGITGDFRAARNEIECLALANPNEEGACVLEVIPGTSGKRDCEFNTRSTCLTRQGEFHQNTLCSEPSLNTICERQHTTQCVEGKDNVYWFDSCGNKENIYDTNRVRSFNLGKILPESESCALGQGNNLFSNQESCGNCNYLLGSVCGTPGTRDSNPSSGDFVCRRMTCIDDKGKERKHGESWCAFDSQIGLEGSGNEQRSVDVPGSSHYRQVCLDGEITTEPCQSGRREVCVEDEVELETGGSFAEAACRVNSWQACFAVNDIDDPAALKSECEAKTDCYLKTVDLRRRGSDNFAFNVCVPKYPVGFDLKIEESVSRAEDICKSASIECKYVKVDGGWFGDDEKYNVACKEPIFTETMNNLCMSLGDCGAHITLEGDYTDRGYSVDGAPRIEGSYISSLRRLLQPEEENSAEPLSDEEITSLLGASPEELRVQQAKIPLPVNILASAGLVVGGLAATGAILSIAGVSLATIIAITPFLNIAGVVIGILLVLGGGRWLQRMFPSIFGGDKSERLIKFQCLPWQPPIGGDKCTTCGDSGLPCNKYKCQSLGQTCEFINEGTPDELCVDVSPDDASAPTITPNQDALEEGFEYESVSNLGYSFTGPTSDGCLPAYTHIQFGIKTNEAAQCKIDIKNVAYEDMTNFFGDSNLYKQNHITEFVLPSLESLQGIGVSAANRREDFNLNVRCEDKSGNSNSASYVINFCLSPQPDITPPIISRFTPLSDSFVSLEATEKEVNFFVNEPSQCRWDSQDVDFDAMINTIQCDEFPEDLTLYGFQCKTSLPINGDENHYYIRCKDQPWLEVNNPDLKPRNSNAQSVNYVLKKTREALTIVSTSPNDETITSGGLPIRVDLAAETSGGAEGVPRYCEYDFGGNGNYVRFFEANGDQHSQPGLNLWVAKEYVIPIRCSDEVGNTANGEIKFNAVVDGDGPLITRAYERGNSLNIVTNENAICKYSTENCAFEFNTAQELTGNAFVHTLNYNRNFVYNVKCKDSLGNIGTQCFKVGKGYI